MVSTWEYAKMYIFVLTTEHTVKMKAHSEDVLA